MHSVLAGLGLGASGIDWGIYAAIMAHKSLAAFALGSNFAALAQPPPPCVIGILLLAFACMTPIGVGLGWWLAGADAEDSAAAGVCSALAAGTFLYVATMELLPDAIERSRQAGGSRVGTNMAIFIGSIGFATLARWT